MVIGKNISCYKRLNGKEVSVIIEHRQKEETLLFEKGVVAELGKGEGCVVLMGRAFFGLL